MNILKAKIMKAFQMYAQNPAITYLDRIISYKELFLESECLANKLYDERYSKIVTVYMERSPETVIAILATILSEKVFCAIDINTPSSSLHNIIKDIESNIVVTDEKNISTLIEKMGDSETHIICFKNHAKRMFIEYGKAVSLPQTISVENVSHIIYTSGSTNIPKGVLASRDSLIHFISWEYEMLHINGGQIHTAQISAPWFDPYARDVFLPLFYGGCICIPNKRQMFESKAFFEFVKKNSVNIIHIVPTIFRHIFLNQIYYDSEGIEHILLAGEMVYGNDIKKYKERYLKGNLYNLYGPTETTMSKFYHPVTEEDALFDRVHVGKPLPDTFCKIIDDEKKEQPFGVEGEVVICTKYASLGYLKRPELNTYHFFRNHDNFIEYRTGDLGILHSKNDLEIIGRKDHMKKIYGQKVHCEEIEAVLLSYSEIKSCAAYVEENEVFALIEIKTNFQFDFLQDLLNKCLIRYKVPSEVIIVHEIPLNKNGKIDRKNISNVEKSNIIKRFPIKLN